MKETGAQRPGSEVKVLVPREREVRKEAEIVDWQAPVSGASSESQRLKNRSRNKNGKHNPGV